LNGPTSASLECLATFLTAVGPSFDRPQWPHHTQFKETFNKIKEHSKRKDLPARTKFLLQDVLDLRASDWENKKKAVRVDEGPTSLAAVHKRAEEELGTHLTPLKRPDSSNRLAYGASTPSNAGSRSGGFGFGSGSGTPAARSSPAHGGARSGSRLAPADNNASSGKRPVSDAEAPSGSERSGGGHSQGGAAPFDREHFQEVIGVCLRELAKTLDVSTAMAQLLSECKPPSPDQQAKELADLLARVAEGSKSEVRRAGFEFAAQLFVTGPWSQSALVQGLDDFFEVFGELKIDIPSLPTVLADDFAPVLAGLVAAGLIEGSQRDKYLESS